MIPVVFKDKSKCYFCRGNISIVTVDGKKYPYNAYVALMDKGISISHMVCDKCGKSFYTNWNIYSGIPSPVFEFEEEYKEFMHNFENAK